MLNAFQRGSSSIDPLFIYEVELLMNFYETSKFLKSLGCEYQASTNTLVTPGNVEFDLIETESGYANLSFKGGEIIGSACCTKKEIAKKIGIIDQRSQLFNTLSIHPKVSEI